MPTQIDIDANADLKDIDAAPGGSVLDDIRVTFRDGLRKDEAFKALQAISSALIGDRIQLD